MIPADTTLRLAIAGVILLSALTVMFMGYAFLLHVRSVRLTRRRQALERTWKRRLLDAATGGREASDRDAGQSDHPEVARRDRVLFLELVTQYVRAVEGPERRNLEHLAERHLPALDALLRDPDPYRRAHGLDILGELGYDDARARIVQGLEDASGLVAMVAARALARRGNPQYVPTILAHLESFEGWSAQYLTSLLVSFGPDAAPALRAFATYSGNRGSLRAVVLRALRELNDIASTEPAVRLLEEEGDTEVQAELVRLIGELGSPEHLRVVRPFADSPQPYVRAAALHAISTLSDRRTLDLEIVTQGLDDASPWVALHAARGLYALGQSDTLIALADSDSPRAELAAEVLESHR